MFSDPFLMGQNEFIRYWYTYAENIIGTRGLQRSFLEHCFKSSVPQRHVMMHMMQRINVETAMHSKRAPLFLLHARCWSTECFLNFEPDFVTLSQTWFFEFGPCCLTRLFWSCSNDGYTQWPRRLYSTAWWICAWTFAWEQEALSAPPPCVPQGKAPFVGTIL